MYKHWFNNVSNTVSTEIQYEDDSELDNTLAISHLLASEMDALVAEIQRQLSVNAASLSGKINKSNYGQAVSYVMYVTTAIMGVWNFFSNSSNCCCWMKPFNTCFKDLLEICDTKWDCTRRHHLRFWCTTRERLISRSKIKKQFCNTGHIMPEEVWETGAEGQLAAFFQRWVNI